MILSTFTNDQGNEGKQRPGDRAQALRQSKIVPDLIYAIEQFERFVIQVN
jgi:hypothetical protein